MDLIERKELVEWLKDVGGFLCGLESTKDKRQFLGKIIDHVEAMPTVEAYSKGAVEQILWERDMAINQLSDCGIPFGGKADVQAVRHGKWRRKHVGNGWDDWDAITCSECSFYIHKPDFVGNYCPNCGARMDGEQQ